MQSYVSVIICTYNRSRLLSRALMAFESQEGVECGQIIVVDNNSTDDTEVVVQHCAELLRDVIPVTYVHEPVQGLSRARNAGITIARGEIVAFLDDDAVPHDGWLLAITKFFQEHPEAAAVGGPIEPEFETARPDWLSSAVEGYFSILDLGDKVIEFPSKTTPFGANMAFRNTTFRETLFSEDLGRKGSSLISREEVGIFSKIRGENGRMFYVPAMRVAHLVPKDRLTKKWLRERSYSEGVSRVLVAETRWSILMLTVMASCKFFYIKTIRLISSNHDAVFFEARLMQYNGIFDAIKKRLTRNS